MPTNDIPVPGKDYPADWKFTHGCVPGRKCNCPRVYPRCIAWIAIEKWQAEQAAAKKEN